jgi:DNA adenine methylase
MRKQKAFAEVYNDLDGHVANIFRVLRDPVAAAELERVLRLTPWSRREWNDSYNDDAADDPIEMARRIIVRGFLSFGTTSRQKRNRSGFRACPFRARGNAAAEWSRYPDAITDFTTRLAGVVIEERDAIRVIRQQDSERTLFYCDPPYPTSTRSAVRGRADLGRAYAHEMTDDDHRCLSLDLRSARGMVVLSGYACALYDEELYPDWHRVTHAARSDGARARTEVLWLNPAAVKALEVTS